VAVSRVCYVSREAVKQAGSIYGPDQDARVDRVIQAESQKFESDSRTWFTPRAYAQDVLIPLRVTLPTVYDWVRVSLLAYLQSVSSVVLHTSATMTVALTSTQYRFIAPAAWVDVDPWALSTFSGYDVVTGFSILRPHLTITGVWSRGFHLAAAGTLDGTITDSVATLTCSDASLVGVGDSLLLSAEQILVADRALVDTTAVLDTGGELAADVSEKTVTVDDGTKVHPGETLTLGAERLYVESVAGDELQVIRQYDGSILETHAAADKLYAPRLLTVVRAQGGTTAASHLDNAPISVYRAPEDVSNAVMAKSIATIEQEQAGYGRVVGTGEGARQYKGKAVLDEWGCTVRIYKRGWSIA
jgi:hypothetical protein